MQQTGLRDDRHRPVVLFVSGAPVIRITHVSGWAGQTGKRRGTCLSFSDLRAAEPPRPARSVTLEPRVEASILGLNAGCTTFGWPFLQERPTQR